MEIKEIISFIEKQISEIEKASFMFENVLLPRYEKDREILKILKEQHVKMRSFQEKAEAGTATQEDVYASIPACFR